MKTILLLVTMLLSIVAQGTQPRLMSVTLPLWYLGAAESDQKILISEVPRVCGGTDAEAWLSLFSRPFQPDGSQVDVNLIAIYKIGISAKQDQDGRLTKIIIDPSNSVNPAKYPFSVEDVTEQVVLCMRREFPDRHLTTIVTIYDGKERSEKPHEAQTDAAQPATRPESKSESGDKPQAESEGRSQ